MNQDKIESTSIFLNTVAFIATLTCEHLPNKDGYIPDFRTVFFRTRDYVLVKWLEIIINNR